MMRKLVSQAYVHGVLPLVDRERCQGLGKRLRSLRHREELSLSENQRLQWEALLRLIQHAYDTTPFYRRRLDSVGLRPCEITSPEDVQKIPPLTRSDIRDHISELWSRRYRLSDLQHSATGGTTDTPVAFLIGPESRREKMAIQLRFNMWAGFFPGDKVFYLWGARSDFSQNPSWRWRLYDRYLMRRVWGPTSLFNEQILESYRQTINRFRPRIIIGYPTPLALFCEYLRDTGRTCHRPSTVICTAEPLLPHQRVLMEDVLGCEVFEHYGAREFGMVAAECEHHQGLHLNPASSYVEFLPVQGAELSGLHEILVTDLLNYGMPLIRYRVNDCALLAPNPCSCGRGYPLVKRIEGRTTDVFYLANGNVVPGVSLTNRVIQVCPGIKKLQIIQDTLTDFRVRFVPGISFTDVDLKKLQNKLDEFLSEPVRWTFEKVNDVPRQPSGKTRFCISHVTRPQVHRKPALEQVSS